MPSPTTTLRQSALIVLSLMGCAAAAGATPPANAHPAQAQAAAGYKLEPGDVLYVSVWNEKDLEGDVLIRPDGGISFPLAGELQAAGRTNAQLTSMLEQRIRKYVPDAVVTVAVKSTGGNRIFVIGKVQRPGDFPLIGPLDVLQALSLAGGGTPFANMNDIRILRRSADRQSAIPFRYGDVEHGKKLPQNILLQSGDTVVVP
ncbi:MAG TPA: polysaccharide biosynthesis/export family protein [Steroidobacteraceae bacterium]|nr:polysaccharide biosynthesis/export family protein [Steroidobacteraceae bacterium]